MDLATREMPPVFRAEPRGPVVPEPGKADALGDDTDDPDLNPDAVALLKGLLAKAPRDRLALESALAHPWFVGDDRGFLFKIEADVVPPPLPPPRSVNSDLWSDVEQRTTLATAVAAKARDAQKKGALHADFSSWEFVDRDGFDADGVEFLTNDAFKPHDYAFSARKVDKEAESWDPALADALRRSRARSCHVS